MATLAQSAISGNHISIEDFEDDFDSINEDWHSLLTVWSGANVFSTPLWCRAWWHSLGAGRAHLLRLSRDGRLVGIAPLVELNGQAVLLGDKEVCDYLDIVSVPGEEVANVRAVSDFAIRNGWEFDLHPIAASSRTLAAIGELGAADGYAVSTAVMDISYLLDLPDSWEGYLASLPAKDRHELRRKIRRLNKTGQATLVSDGDVDGFLQLFRHRADKAAFLHASREAFFRDVMPLLMQAGLLRTYFMEFEGKRVAAAICFDYRGVVSLYNSGFDPLYGDLSVGLICKAWAIREAIQLGRRRFDFLRGDEDYKARLGGRPVEVFRCVVRSRSVGDRVAKEDVAIPWDGN